MRWESTQVMSTVAAALVGAAVATSAAGQAGLVNTGWSIDPATWIRGPLYDAPASHPIWNPAKIKRLAGQEVALGTVSAFSLTNYCTVAGRPANAQGAGASDGTWTEMQHSNLDWTQVWSMWSQSCAYVPQGGPGKPVVPGSRISGPLKRDIQKALDGGAMVLVVPTVDSVQEAQDLIDLIYYPPIGHRKYGPSQAERIYANVPGGYRQTFNDNLVVIFMIETVLGSQAASAIGALPHIDGLFGATSDLGNFSGYVSGHTDYERLIRNAHDAAHANGEGACTAFGFRGRVSSAGMPPPYGGFRYSFNCYQN
jgi:2-keto-3-deoxy-L-rhamnonate aldolase RhmA